MSSNTLSTASPATTCAQLLHLGTGTQAANSPVRLGDGTLTALSLHNSGIGVADIKLGRLGTAARDVKFADSEGVLHPVLRAVLAADAANSTVTAAQLNMAWEGSSTLRAGTYAIRVMCLCRSEYTSVGVHLSLNGPTAQTSVIALQWIQSGSFTAYNAWGSLHAVANSPSATYAFLQTLEGMVTLSADAATAPTLWLNSAFTAYNVQILKGSFMEFSRLV